MITYSGVQIHPGSGNGPTPEDIAVGMCRVTRYAGAIWLPLAAHSILVGELSAVGEAMTNHDLAFAVGLMHDAHEVVTGEIVWNYKLPEQKKFEIELDEVIFRSMNLPIQEYWWCKEHYKAADEKALAIESAFGGLVDFPNYFRRVRGRDLPAVTPEERDLGRRVIGAWSDPLMIVAGSRQIRLLTKALEFIQAGHRATGRRALAY
jgi:hypothetical protein